MTDQRWRSRIVGHGEEAPDQLLANPRNWRVHPKAQQDALAGMLDQVGWVQDVIVNRRTGYLVDGHLRVAAAISRGEPSVPVVYVDLSEQEEAIVLATLDPLAAMAVADGETLQALLAEVAVDSEALRAMLDAVAKDAAAVRKSGLTDPDAVPEPSAQPYVQRGDLYLLGQHRLLCGDSTNVEDVARLMDGEQAMLLATDPPYLVDYQGGNHPQSWSNKPDVKDKHWDEYRDPETAVAFFASYLRTWLPHCAPRVPVYQWHADLRRPFVLTAWEQAGLHPHQVLVWVKARPVLTRSHFMWQHEPCLYGWREGQQPRRKPPTNARSVWEISQQGEQDGIHPTQKPVELFTRPIEYHTRPGEICAEPFAGSGTQLIAAEMTGRRCFAMEVEPRYVQVAIERWERFTGQQAVRA